MGIRKFFTLVFLLSFGFVANADIDELDQYNKLPRGSTIRLKAGELKLAPFGASMLVGKFEKDTDSDGIVDSQDWCSETPKGARVWTKQDATDMKCEPQLVGCSDSGTDKTLYNPRNFDSTPASRSWTCSLRAIPTADDRRLPANAVLTVIDPRDASVTDEEREKLTGVGGSTFSGPVMFRTLMVSTAGGTHFGLNCRAVFRYLTRSVHSNKPIYHQVAFDSLHETSIEEMRKFMDVTIAKPVPIP